MRDLVMRDPLRGNMKSSSLKKDALQEYVEVI